MIMFLIFNIISLNQSFFCNPNLGKLERVLLVNWLTISQEVKWLQVHKVINF